MIFLWAIPWLWLACCLHIFCTISSTLPPFLLVGATLSPSAQPNSPLVPLPLVFFQTPLPLLHLPTSHSPAFERRCCRVCASRLWAMGGLHVRVLESDRVHLQQCQLHCSRCSSTQYAHHMVLPSPSPRSRHKLHHAACSRSFRGCAGAAERAASVQ